MPGGTRPFGRPMSWKPFAMTVPRTRPLYDWYTIMCCTHAIWPCKLRYKTESSRRQQNDSSSTTTTTTLTDSASFPAFYYPNVQVSPSESTPTKLETLIVLHHHKRNPNAVEIILDESFHVYQCYRYVWLGFSYHGH